MTRLLPALLLLSVACYSYGGTYRPQSVVLGDMEPVIDLLFTQVGKTEFAFCLDGVEAEPGFWYVTKVTLPRQFDNDSASVSFICAGYPGFIHNHPTLGGVYENKSPCAWNPADSAVLATMYKFSVTWCGPATFFSYSKVPQ